MAESSNPAPGVLWRRGVSRLMPLIAFATGAALTAGCAGPAQRPIGAELKQVCADTRPQVCTKDYQPVCAHLGNNSRRTYANACSACSDAGVASYIAGACPSDGK